MHGLCGSGGVETLEGIFLTHGHKDHVGGLSSLLQAFPTEAVYYSGSDAFSYQEILPWELAEAQGAEAIPLRGDEVLDLGGVEARVWLPPVPDRENENNNSLVLMLTHGSIRMLLMGDAEQEEEQMLMMEVPDLRADLLKLGHHGEDDASTPAFLHRVQPSIGLIAGNMEENPESVDPVVTARLEAENIQPWYSECDGLGLDFCSDGTAIYTEVLKDRPLPQSLKLQFQEVNRKDQTVVLKNTGDQEADLEGAILYSLRRDEVFFFPEGTCLGPGESLRVSCTDSPIPGDLTWDQPEIWQKKRDDARIYDRNLNLICEDPAR